MENYLLNPMKLSLLSYGEYLLFLIDSNFIVVNQTQLQHWNVDNGGSCGNKEAKDHNNASFIMKCYSITNSIMCWIFP